LNFEIDLTIPFVLEVDNVGAKTNLDIYLFTICKEIKETNTEIDIF
jgi:hypothetical protein